MSRIADEIASQIADGIPSATPWQSVGDAVAGAAGRVVYYLRGAAVAGFAQSLVGAVPDEGLLTASPTSATPAYLAQAAMDINVPGLGVWPEHRMFLHLWTDAPFLPAGERYGVLVTLLQVDADGATVTTIGQHVEEGDPYYTGDIFEPNVRHSVLGIDVPQMVGTGLRLAVLLQAWTSSADPVLVELYVGGGWASCIETSLTAANGGAGGGGSGTTTILDSPDDSIDITPDGEIDGGGGGEDGGGPADSLATTDDAVDVSAASPPVAGQVLTATSATEATWQAPSSGVTLPIAQSDVTGLTDALAGKVSTALTINTHALTGNLSLTAADVGADAAGAAAAVTKTTLGLGNVDNTSDANKPVSTAQATAIGLKLDANDPSVTNARTPTAHAASHTTGADQLSDATASAHGLATAAQITKLDGIAAGATVGADWNSNISNKPTLGTAAAKNIPATGNASATEVVYGSDTRLSDARTPTTHSHAEGDITNLTTDLANKVTANASISGATKTKITYDAKGLVTSGADATTADIADSSDKRYCTDAQKTVISNTSGTNSGNETATTIKSALGITTLSGSNTGDQTLPTDATIATTDVSTNDASTTKHGWQPKATAPAANQLAVVGIANGETVTTYKVIIGSTTPTTQAFGDSAAHGTSLEAAPIDHKHGMPSAPSGITLPQAMIVASFRG